MAQYQTDQDTYEYEEETPDYYHKRKRLASDFAPNAYYRSQRHPVAEVVAWAVVGIIGVAMTAGSIIVADQSNEAWVMIIPLVYMLAAMWMLRR